MKFINDWHLGAVRQAGTTVESRAALTEYQFEEFEAAVNPAEELCILGDLFDKPTVPLSVVWRTFAILAKFLNQEASHLYLVAGNHDQSNINGEMSSLDFLAKILLQAVGEGKVTYITEPTTLTPGVKVIPHMQNQDIFDVEIARADKEGIHTLLLHCNYDNFFATEQDHSLNISKEQAQKFGTIILAHEHTPRIVKEGDTLVWVLGCQAPTSIADCKGKSDFIYTFADLHTGKIKSATAMALDKIYIDIHWQELGEDLPQRFVRVSGTATAEEAGQATQAVSKFRKHSTALVVTNAIAVEGMSCEEDIAEATEEITKLNIIDMFFTKLKPWEVTALKAIQAGETPKLSEVSSC